MKMNVNVLFLLVLGFVASKAENITMTNDQLTEYIQECLLNSNIDSGFRRSTNSEENLRYITEVKRSCFMACMYKKAGIIKPDGSIRPAVDKLDPTTTEVIKACKQQAKFDVCELAWCLNKSDSFNIPIVSGGPVYELN